MRQREWRRRERRCSIQRKGGLFDGDREELRRAGDKEQLEKEKKAKTRNCSRSGERDRQRETRRGRRGYITAFITQHVLWTDGGELCIKAAVLLHWRRK